ncbi:MAG TPA: PilZ domain-containing protein [Xanthobacteraceae bacterium]|nr:PilZ domain-containing protein [Xanthobacteraceae bacterium]
MSVERRTKPRQALNRDALVCFADGKPIAGCHVCDVSAAGARLALPAGELAKLPEEFILVLAPRGKVRRRCRVVWRTAEEVGVRFGK